MSVTCTWSCSCCQGVFGGACGPGPGCARLVALVLAVLLGAGGLAACSPGQGGAGPSIPPLEDVVSASAPAEASGDGATGPGAGGVVPSAGATVSDPGEVSAESLSNPETGFKVASVPEDLDEEQALLVAAYTAHEHATWVALRSADGSSRDDVEATTTGEAMESFADTYDALAEAGQHMEGTYTVSVDDLVTTDSDGDTALAVLQVCSDQRDIAHVSSSAEEQPQDTQDTQDTSHTYTYNSTLIREDGAWKVSQQQQTGVDQCEP